MFYFDKSAEDKLLKLQSIMSNDDLCEKVYRIIFNILNDYPRASSFLYKTFPLYVDPYEQDSVKSFNLNEHIAFSFQSQVSDTNRLALTDFYTKLYSAYFEVCHKKSLTKKEESIVFYKILNDKDLTINESWLPTPPDYSDFFSPGEVDTDSEA
jgi:hypothetical protein